jgi:hypothetical protein
MNSQLQKDQGWLYGLAFLLALALRLVQLGALPLTDSEATFALQALHLSQGLKPALGPQPAYILLTASLFYLFGGGTNFLARLVPALAGSFLVFAPLLFRHRFKSNAPLILAFFLALDPALLALSRQAASAILAAAFLLFAWGFWNLKRPAATGIFSALALLSGTSIWSALLSVGIAWSFQQFIESDKQDPEEAKAGSRSSAWIPSPPSSFLIPFVSTLIAFGTLFFLAPNGLSAALASIPAYLSGWVRPSGFSNALLLSSLLVYQPLAVFLALICIARAWWQGRRRAVRLSLWMLTALLLASFYPARQMADLIWAVIPLLALASIELARHFLFFPEERLEVRGVILLTVFILTFAWLDLASLSWTQIPSPQGSLRVWLFLGSILLLVLSYLLVAAGWSFRIAKLGAVWGLTISLGILTLASGMGAAGLRGANTAELWLAAPRPNQAQLLLSSVNDLSDWNMGNKNSLPVEISGVQSPALEWLLREHPLTIGNNLDAASSPDLVITPLQENIALASSYRGQDFIWNQQPAWAAAKFGDWLRWYTLRQMPFSSETIILWARADLFLDASHPAAP